MRVVSTELPPFKIFVPNRTINIRRSSRSKAQMRKRTQDLRKRGAYLPVATRLPILELFVFSRICLLCAVRFSVKVARLRATRKCKKREPHLGYLRIMGIRNLFHASCRALSGRWYRVYVITQVSIEQQKAAFWSWSVTTLYCLLKLQKSTKRTPRAINPYRWEQKSNLPQNQVAPLFSNRLLFVHRPPHVFRGDGDVGSKFKIDFRRPNMRAVNSDNCSD